MKTTTKILREHSLKVTPQRLAIYNYLYETTEHPIAERIYYELCAEYPTMSLSTVYKTLDILKNKGLALELNAGEGSFRYDANTNPHDHFYCLSCKSLIDVMNDKTATELTVPSSLKNCKVEYERSYYFGYCETCVEKVKLQ